MSDYGKKAERNGDPLVFRPAHTLRQGKQASMARTGHEADGPRISGVDPLLRRVVELGPNPQATVETLQGLYSVADYGAQGDGVADDTEAIQAAIDAAEGEMDRATELVNDRMSASPGVFFPAGTYKVSASLTITHPIRLQGMGYLHSLVYSETDAPIFHVTQTITRLYAPVTFEALGIAGDRSQGTKTNQHGIQVNYDAGGLDCTLEVRFCSIQGCGSNGIYFPDNANTPRILGCLIQTNWGDGINFSGTFATNARILHNVINENRRGIFYDGTTAAANVGSAAYLYSGHIAYNLIEANFNGTGQIGSSSRPSQGVALLNARHVTVESNYFEKQLNHVFIDQAAGLPSAYNIIQRNFFSGVSQMPGLVPGFSGPARKPCDIAIASAATVGIVCRDNTHEIPTRPAGTSVTDWSNAAWADVLPVFAIIDGEKHILDEGWGNGAGVETANTPFFRRLADGGQESFGVTRGAAGLTLSPLDGTFAANEYVALTGQLSPYDAAGKSQLRFTRRADGGGYIEVVANNAASVAGRVALFLGTEKAVQLGTGGLFDSNGVKVIGTQGALVADASATVASVQAQLNALLARCRAHGIIAT